MSDQTAVLPSISYFSADWDVTVFIKVMSFMVPGILPNWELLIDY